MNVWKTVVIATEDLGMSQFVENSNVSGLAVNSVHNYCQTLRAGTLAFHLELPNQEGFL